MKEILQTKFARLNTPHSLYETESESGYQKAIEWQRM